MNILIFAFATFFLWGWILLWPISKIQNHDKLKAYLVGIVVTPIALSLLFVICCGKNFHNIDEVKDLYFGSTALLWWSLYIFGAIVSAVGIRFINFIEDYYDSVAFAISATLGSWFVAVLIFGTIHWLTVTLFWNGLISPLIHNLF